MKVVVMTIGKPEVAYYEGVTSIAKAGSIVTISYGTSSTASYSANTHSVFIMET